MIHKTVLAIPATVSLRQASERLWDVVVIGAGPAGALAALRLADSDLSVLLVDKRAFPRDKVCGGCFSARAVQVLESAGMGYLPLEFGTPLHQFCLSSGRRRLEVPLTGSWALSRNQFDAALVRAAIEHGVAFLPEVNATVARNSGRDAVTPADPEPGSPPSEASGMEWRRVVVEQPKASVAVTARVLLAADGLGSPCTAKLGEFSTQIDRRARIGVAATLPCSDRNLAVGVIYMTVSRCGYVGLVRLGNQNFHVAAAIDPPFLRHYHNTHLAVAAMLGDPSWWPANDDACQRWHGTLPLTRTVQRPASWRLLLIGDAAGYVEPFTGEGITWALEGAMAAARLVKLGAQHWTSAIEEDWTRQYRLGIRNQQRWCRALTRLLRFQTITKSGILACQLIPGLTNYLARRILKPAETVTREVWFE